MTRPLPKLSPGQSLGGRTVGPISQTHIVRFAGAGGDFNPLHHDRDYAQRAGLPDVIAMGQLQAGMLAGWLTDMTGVEHLAGFAVRFASPLSVGETLELGGHVDTVDAADSESSDAIAHLVLQAQVGDRTVISATARVRCQL